MEKELYKELFDVERKHWWFLSKRNIILSLLKLKVKVSPGLKLLDAGCGCGLTLSGLDHWGETWGMDSAEEALDYSKIFFKGNLVQGRLPDHVPFPDGNFDVIMALDVLEHIENDPDALKTLYNKLKHGGFFFITVPAFMQLWCYHDDSHHHKRRYNRKELGTKLQAAGFNIEKISYYNTLLFFPILIVRAVNKIFKTNKSHSDASLPGKVMNFLLLKIFTFEKFLLRSFNLPFGVSLLAIGKKE